MITSTLALEWPINTQDGGTIWVYRDCGANMATEKCGMNINHWLMQAVLALGQRSPRITVHISNMYDCSVVIYRYCPPDVHSYRWFLFHVNPDLISPVNAREEIRAAWCAAKLRGGMPWSAFANAV